MTTLEAHGQPHGQAHGHRTTAASPHEHGWVVESGHTVSTGRILYVRCAGCGVRRVDQQEDRRRPPVALSRETAR
ncbi:hypothetical protein MWU57_03425 [Isoptericola sp. S6320L]|uniref:hypothetical protein n=1 Tax=Isoptericola sp. S6320L TaxID=2926411 RepID=UPI001FF2CE6E|nr:hypothetical protein [Isoptericola sp. S6320L]MCK0116072.1 hypothetical protein [Isoptericola sp. S6320L]